MSDIVHIFAFFWLTFLTYGYGLRQIKIQVSMPMNQMNKIKLCCSSPSDINSTKEMLRLNFSENSRDARLQTAVISYTMALHQSQLHSEESDGNCDFRIDLIPVVHLADAEYFDDISRESVQYDRFFYELITSEKSTAEDEIGFKRVNSDLTATLDQMKLAKMYGLSCQMERLNIRANKNWSLADLSLEEIQLVQSKIGKNPIGSFGIKEHFQEVFDAFLVGKSSEGKVLPKFFLSRSLNISALAMRCFMWLLPCPEIQIMLFDWARAWPIAGGLSRVISAVLDFLLKGNLTAARKLIFAQQLAANQYQEQKDSSPLVLLRNDKVINMINKSIINGESYIAVMYGFLHMNDIQTKLQKKYEIKKVEVKWKTAWKINATKPSVVLEDSDTNEKRSFQVFTILASLAYISLDALDWKETFINAAVHLENFFEYGDGMSVCVAIASLVFYVFRHVYIYYGLAYWVILWDKELFSNN